MAGYGKGLGQHNILDILSQQTNSTTRPSTTWVTSKTCRSKTSHSRPPQLDLLHQQGGYPSFSSTKKTADPQLAMAKLKNKPVRSSVGRGSARGSPSCRGVFYRRSRPKYVWPEGLWKCSQEAGRNWQQIYLQPIFLNKFHFSLICQELLYEGKNLYLKIIVESENDPILE